MKWSLKKKIVYALLALVIILSTVVSIVYFNYKSNIQPYSTSDEPLIIDVPMGSSIKKIGEILEDNKIIKSANAFYFYAKGKGALDLRAGTYQLSPSMSLDNIISVLEEGKVYVENVKFTVPEGFTVEKIADLLQAKGLVDREEFLQAVNNEDFSSDVWFINHIPKEAKVKYKMEGFLFPKTYSVKKDASAKDIILMMLKQTEKEFPKEWLGELQKRKVTFHDAITLASIIEREAVVDAERSKIAQVYYNRIRTGMKLQADATVQYSLGEQKERILYSDLEIDSLYNTYKYKGFPPGPIANPGIEAIKAAVFPETHDYLFYVTKKDGSGGHYFAKTFNEHKENIAISKKN